MQVFEIMKKALVIDDHITIKDAAKIMSKKNIGSLIVIKNKKIIGIITERDVMKNISNINLKVSDIMSKKVRTISTRENIDIAADIMIKKKIKRLPVVSNNNLKGIITMTDVLAHTNVEMEEEPFLFD